MLSFKKSPAHYSLARYSYRPSRYVKRQRRERVFQKYQSRFLAMMVVAPVLQIFLSF